MSSATYGNTNCAVVADRGVLCRGDSPARQANGAGPRRGGAGRRAEDSMVHAAVTWPTRRGPGLRGPYHVEVALRRQHRATVLHPAQKAIGALCSSSAGGPERLARDAGELYSSAHAKPGRLPTCTQRGVFHSPVPGARGHEGRLLNKNYCGASNSATRNGIKNHCRRWQRSYSSSTHEGKAHLFQGGFHRKRFDI